MILVDARCEIVPERHRDFMHEFEKISAKVRREAGCTRYDLFSDSSVPGHFHFLEEWESEQHLEGHLAQPHMQEFFLKTRPWNSSPAQLKIYEVLSSRKITKGD